MSVTIIQQPTITPAPPFVYTHPVLSAGNDNIYTVSGTTLNQANVFEYKFIADIYVNGILQVTLKSFPDPTYGFGVFNTRNILTSFISFDYFPNPPTVPANIFNACPNTSCRAQLVFGEEYTSGNTFIQNRNIISGNTCIYVNASQSYTDEINAPFIGFSSFAGFFTSRVGSSSFVSSPLSPSANLYNTYTNQRETLYTIANEAVISGGTIPETAYISGIYVFTYNAAGAAIGQYVINNASSGSTTDVIEIEVGYNQLAAIVSASSTVSALFGTFPILTPSVAYYAILRTLTSGQGATGAVNPKMFYQIQTDCGRFAAGAYTISWLNTYGGFNTWLFNKKNETTQNNSRQSYKKIQGALNANGSYSLNTNSRSEVPYYTVLKDSIVMYTDFLLDTDVLYLKSLISSPVVYMTDQNGLTTSVVVKDGSYRINKHINQKIYSLEMTVEQSYNDYRQVL